MRQTLLFSCLILVLATTVPGSLRAGEWHIELRTGDVLVGELRF